VLREFPVIKILRELEQDDLLPAILFRSARKQCNEDLEFLYRAYTKIGLKRAQSDSLREKIDELVERYKLQKEVVYNHEQYEMLIRTGVGAHHAGQLLAWRLILEELMSAGMLRLLIATGTVAAGVDFPARSVVITAHSKRGSKGFNVLSPSEFQQMSGRAGRRGKDAVGVCILAPSPYSDARVLHEVAKRPPEPLRSAYYAAPSTVLNLLKFRNVEELRYTVKRSLAAFLDRKAAKALHLEIPNKENERIAAKSEEQQRRIRKKINRLEREALLLETKHETHLEISLEALTKLEFIDGNTLTSKGLWAAELYTSYVLEIAQAIDQGVFEDISLEQLVGIIASISGDAHRSYFNLKTNPLSKELYKRMVTIVNQIRDTYVSQQNSEVSVLPDAALTVLTWMECKDWTEFSSLLKLNGVTEGDAARLITQTADNLNQISRLSDSHRNLAEIAAQGRYQILRPPFSDTFILE
jgi:ATP-dependent RNA helicase HelY